MRCPYCHTAPDDAGPCGSCGALQHDDCWRAHGRCAGCDRTRSGRLAKGLFSEFPKAEEASDAELERCAASGDPEGLVRLGRKLAKEEQGCTRAKSLFQRAADSDHLEGIVRYAQMLEDGGDPDGALREYRKAADGGSPSAMYFAARLLERGDPLASSLEILALYGRAADLGLAPAKVRLTVLGSTSPGAEAGGESRDPAPSDPPGRRPRS